MSKEIKAALHVAMEAIDAKLRHTGLKPGHENDLRAAKGVLRSMISNLPAASGHQDDELGKRFAEMLIEYGNAAFDCGEFDSDEANASEQYKALHDKQVALEKGLIEFVLSVAHPAPAQQESEPIGHVVVWNKGGSGEVRRIEPIGKPGVSLARELEEGALLYTRAPAPAALTDEQIVEAVRAEKVLCVHPDASTTIDIGRAVLKAASAAPAEQARDALNEACLRACGNLPTGYNVRIELENGAGWVEWTRGDAEWHLIDGDGYLSSDVHEAIEAATADSEAIASQQKGGV